jgi:hypothetical protein
MAIKFTGYNICRKHVFYIFAAKPNITNNKYFYHVENVTPDKQVLIDIVKTRMPFGKYKGTLICDIPVYYLEWLKNKGGFPPGKMGMLLSTTYEIRINGLSKILALVKASQD